LVKKYFELITLFFLILFQSAAFCQIYSFHYYTMNEGLISNNVETICQDSLGYIWCGTWEGISSYDSREFRNYSTANGLSSNKILDIIADKRKPGVVWIGTEGGGVDKFEKGKFCAFGLSLPDRMKNINTLYEDMSNNIWCGTDSGFYLICNNKIQFASIQVKTGAVFSFAQKNDSSILIGCEKGIYKYLFKSGSISKFNFPILKGRGFNSIIADNQGNIFTLSLDGFIFKINHSGILKLNLRTAPRSMIEDDSGNLWVASYGGIIKINKNNFNEDNIERFTTGTGLKDNNVASLLFDRESILWIGSDVNGIAKFAYQNLFKFEVPQNTKTMEWVTSANDNDNHTWFAFNNGLIEVWKDKIDNWHYYVHTIKRLNLENDISAMTVDQNNYLYLSMAGKIIYIVKIIRSNLSSNLPSKLEVNETIDMSEKLKCSSTFKIMIDKLGYIWWCALDQGIIVINKSKPRNIVKIYSDKDGLPDNSIRAIYQDKDGNYWFGGYDHGLAEFSKDKVLSDFHPKYNGKEIFNNLYTTSTGLPGNAVRSIDQTDDGSILIGTRYDGIAVYKDGRFKTINKNDGLLSNGIWSITISKDKKIWIGTQAGVQVISELGVPRYNLYEEIPKIPFYSVINNDDNSLCFANQEEIYVYQPSMEKASMPPPPVYINHLLINGKEVNIEDNISLQSYQNTITFEFVAVTNKKSKNTIYKYKLLNVDKNWNKLIHNNSITYASLSPGKYSFKVIAVIGDNLESITPSVVKFVIHAPFYLQWWFIISSIVLILTAVIAAARMRVRRLIEIERIRIRIAADLHDEIGSGLTRIAILSEHALREEKKLAGIYQNNVLWDEAEKFTRNDSIERVGRIARSLVDSMIDVIWSIDPKYDSLKDFIFHFKNFAYEVCEAKGIKLIIETKNIEDVKVNSQIKRSMQLITKESLNNSLKYSDCKTIKLLLSVKNKYINLIIEDDGKGFNMKTVKNGRGIFNISKHIKDLSGEFDLQAREGVGTSLIIKFPIKT